MIKYLHVYYVTDCQDACNNRDETIINRIYLKKINDNGIQRTKISAPAIKFSYRLGLEKYGLDCNRKVKENENGMLTIEYSDPLRNTGKLYSDDKVFGFFATTKPKPKTKKTADTQDNNDSEETKGKGIIRRACFNATPGISLREYKNKPETHFAAPGVAQSSKKQEFSMGYEQEHHWTEYQGYYQLQLNDSVKPIISQLLDGLFHIPPVAGGHSNYFYDYTPQSVIFRYTSYPSGNLSNVFGINADGNITTNKLVKKIKNKDIDPNEIYVCGDIVDNGAISELIKNNLLDESHIIPGVYEGFKIVENIIKEDKDE